MRGNHYHDPKGGGRGGDHRRRFPIAGALITKQKMRPFKRRVLLRFALLSSRFPFPDSVESSSFLLLFLSLCGREAARGIEGYPRQVPRSSAGSQGVVFRIWKRESKSSVSTAI
ncbi:hypothetical protein C4D60_Mb11t22680 [Musa balbisiana]|uniref:Uncharacterized protein n=1 Tax=Musa balbisiana TaxID=52838 RepID=A0A4S8J616_MUSBA|nr:hypothetical protein C4D60_Mb11t22680 [Musa balbisiana]